MKKESRCIFCWSAALLWLLSFSLAFAGHGNTPNTPTSTAVSHHTLERQAALGKPLAPPLAPRLTQPRPEAPTHTAHGYAPTSADKKTQPQTPNTQQSAEPTQKMGFAKRTAYKALGKLAPRRGGLRWYHWTLAAVAVWIGGSLAMTAAKGWEMTMTNVGFNLMRLGGIMLVLFFLGLIIYGIIVGGQL